MTDGPRVVELPDRVQILTWITRALVGSGGRWAWQGEPDAPARWSVSTGPADLDVWCDSVALRALTALMAQLPGAVVADTADPARLRHRSWAVETSHGLAVVDATVGDLCVGPVLMVPASAVADAVDPQDHVLTGVAGAADLLVRPLLRGRVPSPSRLQSARERWREASRPDRDTLRARLGEQLGRRTADTIHAALDGAPVAAATARRARAELVAHSLRPRRLRSTWRARRSVLPAGRSAGPLGLRTRGVVVVMVGTDGAGKSTVSDQTAERLQACGFEVREAYFGMARGNLPGVGLARRLLGIPSETGASDESPREAPSKDSTSADREELAYPALRRAGAWYYAVEYGWRYLRDVARYRRRGDVVLCDRYVYDLADSPWPGSPAATFAQWLIPHPDILVLADAPVALIHARKPERTLADQDRQQGRYRALLASRPAGYRNLRVDTSGGTPDPVRAVVAATVGAAHAPRARPGADGSPTGGPSEAESDR